MADADFIYTYFIKPIYSGEGYNIINTIAYSFVLIALLFFFYKLSEKIKFKWDTKALLAILPFIAFTSFARVLTDAGIYERGFWTVTPGIEFLILIPSILFIFASKYFLGQRYYKFCFFVGLVLALSQLFFLSYPNPSGILLILLYSSASISPLLLLRRKIPLLRDSLNLIAFAVHLFDASATSVSIRFFDYFEQHVFPSFMINLFFPEIMFVLKIIFVGLALYILDKSENSEVIKIVIICLGIGPGLRDALRLAALT